MQTLKQEKSTVIFIKITVDLWWRRRDSNSRPLGCEPNALPAELQAHFYELFEGEPRGSRMRYNTIAKTVPLALPAELQALIDFFGGIDANHLPDACATSPNLGA